MPNSIALISGDVRLRLVRMRDHRKLEHELMASRAWLRPWEATSPYAPNSFDVRGMIRGLLRSFDDQTGLPFIIEYRDRIVGQLNVANIMHGSVSSAVIGYWVAADVAGKGIVTTSVGLVTDYLFNVMGLHRVEIAIRPENAPSLRVVAKLGFRYEGYKQRYIHINGAWRDHMIFALTREEVPSGVLLRYQKGQVPTMTYPTPPTSE